MAWTALTSGICAPWDKAAAAAAADLRQGKTRAAAGLFPRRWVSLSARSANSDKPAGRRE